ncbi:gamma-glutamyl-gamma-aminobutyrate hydrolase family protein [Microbacterium sp. P26]|uniref:gamma-glutamyl-gamma-aminobutyrate hydrolase family protein n=1 Tax=Microbacterium TaxID=33882 RepID=UPI0020409CB3|nr:gamma-glutamyl-gamma-aminobutyrate hydrolase family protein [Microbacterium sp. P26]MCM3501171.1 gamma-glutamyl-gamma-aminobutyrate hydrolase family protein [Microbacterium sp. P26]
MTAAPRVLITAGEGQDAVPYERAVRAAGGDPLVRRPSHGFDAYLATDPEAIVLAGGASVAPEWYGSGYESGVSFAPEPDRDAREFALLEHPVGRTVPLLGICRGMQVLNVALGGTLWQHLPSGDWIDTHDPDLERTHLAHTVRATGGHLGVVLGNDDLHVNSIHEQAVRDLAPGLRATVHTSDGLVEGVETPDLRIVAVQWHPEELAPLGHPSHRLFDDLVQRALSARLALQKAAS